MCGLYARYVLPRLVHLACGQRPIERQRRKVVPRARGRVLEVGIGTGLNLPHYDPARVTRLWGVDPSPAMTRRTRTLAASLPFELDVVDAPGEEIPLAGGSIDTVVLTFTLCSIAEPQAALAEMRRVLAPGGKLVFCEHGAAPDASVRRWQRLLTPLWKRLSGGCHLDRDIPEILAAGGFRVEGLETMYLPGWRPATFNYWGQATPE